ncbi:uncharacterized protein LOC113295289 [Papaver somniferum]|uniref:uncharacterized protein LOC113295289 n=1 Tax=Papaver somniferum TaxID=3469 RepID=UPI000E6FF87F|nr:uncharacterized protein LOC113295289 [Papaver somniferum]
MSNLIKFDFAPLLPKGGNYISWVLDAEFHLEAKNLGHTIRNGDSMTSERACAAADLRGHLSATHKDEFMACRDPQVLWDSLKERYYHLKVVMLPNLRNEWIHWRFRDFKSVSDYNSALYRITAQLQLCGDTVTVY